MPYPRRRPRFPLRWIENRIWRRILPESVWSVIFRIVTQFFDISFWLSMNDDIFSRFVPVSFRHSESRSGPGKHHTSILCVVPLIDTSSHFMRSNQEGLISGTTSRYSCNKLGCCIGGAVQRALLIRKLH